MKNFKLIILMLVIFSFMCTPVFAQAVASIEWEKSIHECGEVIQNVPVKVEFNFKNNSLVPLIINDVEPSCDCSVAEYPKKPIMPGKSAKIIVEYDAKLPGFFQKSFIVKSNSDTPQYKLIIKGDVVRKKTVKVM